VAEDGSPWREPWEKCAIAKSPARGDRVDIQERILSPLRGSHFHTPNTRLTPWATLSMNPEKHPTPNIEWQRESSLTSAFEVRCPDLSICQSMPAS